MALVMGSIQLGIIYGLLAVGIYITFRILNIPDLTCEGTFTLGLAVSATMTKYGHPFIALAIAAAAGMAAGMITGLLQSKCKIHPILAGILVMSGLYPINLVIMGRSPNLAIMDNVTIFKWMNETISNTKISHLAANFASVSTDISKIITALVFTAAVVVILAMFFKTHTGLAIRATGDNEDMVRASSIDADKMKIIALAVGNGVIALCGALITQYQNYADINSGAGTLVLGLASVIIGEVIFFKRGVTAGLISAVVGSIIYRFVIALAMKLPFFDASYLKLVSSVIVILALSIPAVKERVALSQIKRRGGKSA